MSGIVAWWARNGVAANLLMIVAFIGGTFGFLSLEREVFPQADFNGATVSIAWPGASPQDVEEQIVTRLEEVVADIDGLKRLTGIARESVGTVNLESNLDVDIDEFVDIVKLRVDQITNLPRASFPPQVQRWSTGDTYMGLTLHGNVDARTLKQFADKVRDDIALLPGGELASVQGTLAEEVSIEVSEENLRRYGLTFSDVANAVRGSSLNSSGGRVRTDTGTVAIQARSLADTADDFGNIIIRQSIEFGTIRIRDVADVIDGFEDVELDATFNGELSTFIMIGAPEKMDILNYADGIKAYMERANSGVGKDALPEALKVEILFDTSEIFKGRMNTITSSAMLGLFMVLVILVLFLRPIVAFWVAVGIMTAFAGGVMLLPLFGISWNIMSLFAVLLVIGVVVDDAIIVGENIHRENESGRRGGLDASIVGTQLVLKPVVFGVITTMIMFAPWMLLPGPERQFTQQISYVVIAALSFSLIESMLILPAHLGHLKPQKFTGAGGKLMILQRKIADSLLWFAGHIYKPVLEAAIRFRYVTIALFACTFFWAIALITTGILPVKVMPEIEDDLIQVTVDLPDGTPMSRALEVRDQLSSGVAIVKADLIEQYPDLEGPLVNDISIVVTARNVRAWIGLLAPEKRPDRITTKQLASILQDSVGEVPDAEEVKFNFTVNQSDNSYRMALNSNDLDLLRLAAHEVKTKLATYDETSDIGDNLSSAAEEVRLTLKPGAESLGINLAQVSNQVRQAYYGEEAQRLPRNGEDVKVMVRYPAEARHSLDSLRSLRVRTADGREIPLMQVADISFEPGVNRIMRRERKRSVTVFADLHGEGARGLVTKDMNETFWPDFDRKYPDISRGAVGEAESSAEFFTTLIQLYLISMGFMYILLAIAFRSYSQPLLLMVAIPFAFAGAAFGHVAFGAPMAIFSLFGIGAAAGVVINDNLVLLDYINRRREDGAGAVQALVDAGVSRFRPVLLTSVTTFVGILPMMTQRSIQAQFLKPMVISLGCAVAFALFVSLIMVPALYAVGVEVGRVFRWTWAGRPYRHIGETYEGEANIDEEELTHRPLGDAAPAE